jgi:hypothetical protein
MLGALFPTIAAQANARRTGREAEFQEALNRFCDEWNRGAPDRARFEQEYLLAVVTSGWRGGAPPPAIETPPV